MQELITGNGDVSHVRARWGLANRPGDAGPKLGGDAQASEKKCASRSLHTFSSASASILFLLRNIHRMLEKCEIELLLLYCTHMRVLDVLSSSEEEDWHCACSRPSSSLSQSMILSKEVLPCVELVTIPPSSEQDRDVQGRCRNWSET